MPSLQDIYEQQRQAAASTLSRPLGERLLLLDKIIELLRREETRIVDAMAQDFGTRCAQESILTDIALVTSEAKFACRHLRRWMKMRRVKTELLGLPGYSRLLPQPLGVVGILGTWNYPFATVFAGAVGALAAGNRVIAKPSEVAPITAALMAGLVRDNFDTSDFAIVIGDATLAAELTRLPLDHILFTGSPAVGAMVAESAARNLTPVTLELGGKSPAIVDDSADISRTVEAIVRGKFMNAGQTCIGVDYVLVSNSQKEAFIAELSTAVRNAYSTIADNSQYTSIINARQYRRLEDIVADARSRGARMETMGYENEDCTPENKRMAPVLIVDPEDDMRAMQEEIFGPILPVKSYDCVDEAIETINAGERPLALYWFGNDIGVRDRVIRETHAGGVTVNGTVMHIFQRYLPFGGIGHSGQGAYLGEGSFRRFSHFKPIYYQSRINPLRLLTPPFSAATDRLLTLLKRLL